jgi:hypothetical protein
VKEINIQKENTIKSIIHVKIGSKLVIRNQKDYFGKGLQVLSHKNNFYMQMNF